jgi:hypothetical protein
MVTIPESPAATAIDGTELFWIWQNGQLRRTPLNVIPVVGPRGTVTLTPFAASTVVVNPSCATGTVVMLSPQTAHAAAGATTTYAVPYLGYFVVNHANNSYADRIFSYVLA